MSIPTLSFVGQSEWDERKANHLLNRAGFGAPASLVDKLAGMPPAAAVDHLVSYEDIHFSFPDPEFIISREAVLEVNREVSKLRKAENIDEADRLRQKLRRAENAAIATLATWWLERMYSTPRPLEEKLTLFWQGHFVVSSQKVNDSEPIYNHHKLLRENASGSLKKLTTEVGKSPAMLRYLDNARSTKQHPNENWARELMELFTMGQGNYTEDDIKESARAFTGWSLKNGEFAYRPQSHDDGEKTFLGKTGRFEGSDIIDIIFEQDVTARYFATELWTYFAYENPEPEVIDALAATLQRNNFYLKPMLRQMFLSKAFYSDRAIGQQIKSPAQFVVKLAHDMYLYPVPYREMSRASAALGQNVFAPPNVKGWDGGSAWINANALITRYNLPGYLAAAPPEPLPSVLAREPFSLDAMMTGSMRMMNPMKQRSQDIRNNLEEMLKAMPKRDAQEFRQKLKAEKDPTKRRQMVLALMDEVNPDARWRADRVYEVLQFNTAGQAVEALSDHYLSVDPGPQQRSVLMTALGARAETDRLSPESVPVRSKNAALHLLLSSAEYQLC